MVKKIILGSKSPRRQELIKAIGFPVELKTKEVEENYPENMAPENVAEFLAEKKSKALRDGIKEDELLITSDTVVLLNHKILGKPADKEDATLMLQQLSGKQHEVITGVCLYAPHKTISFSNVTRVYFDILEDTEIERYIEQYQPFDKAGSYGIQEWIGYIGIRKIEGCYYNVMGLPVNAIYQRIKQEF